MQFLIDMLLLAHDFDSSLIEFLQFCAIMGHHPLIIDLLKFFCFHSNFGALRFALKHIHEHISELKELDLLVDSCSSDPVTIRDEVQDYTASNFCKIMSIFIMRSGQRKMN